MDDCEKKKNANIKSANYEFLRILSNPPNLVLANISGYTVVLHCHMY